MSKYLNLILVIIIGGMISIIILGSDKKITTAENKVVTIDNTGTQIINITAKGGYNPNKISAKAGVNTILNITTKGTIDCSSVFVIPKLNIKKNLPPNGETKIEIGQHNKGETLTATCSMSMYKLEIEFE